MRKVCDLLGIDMAEEVMSFGDSDNDLPMLRGSKVAVAMGNAEDIVKENADYVCLDNNQQGVSVFLKEYFKDLL